jgi:hypothetical protein
MKIIIEVSGGVVSNIVATEEVSIFLVDHDNLSAEGSTEEARQEREPDCIYDDEDFEIELDRILGYYEQ